MIPPLSPHLLVPAADAVESFASLTTAARDVLSIDLERFASCEKRILLREMFLCRAPYFQRPDVSMEPFLVEMDRREEDLTLRTYRHYSPEERRMDMVKGAALIAGGTGLAAGTVYVLVKKIFDEIYRARLGCVNFNHAASPTEENV